MASTFCRVHVEETIFFFECSCIVYFSCVSSAVSATMDQMSTCAYVRMCSDMCAYFCVFYVLFTSCVSLFFVFLFNFLLFIKV
jgi:hypothetical protein